MVHILRRGCGGGSAIPWVLLLLAALVGCRRTDADAITRVSRQNNSGTYHYFREAVLGENREFKLGSIDQSGSKDVVELVSKVPSAIGYSGMGYANDRVKMLKVSRKKGEPAASPTIENAQKGIYPLSRPLYIYTVGEPQGEIRAYLNWILSSEGQDVVALKGYVPVEPTRLPDVPEQASGGETRIRVAGSDTMVNLAQAWSEEYGKKRSDVSIEVMGQGSGVGIAQLMDGTTDLANASREMTTEERERAMEKRGAEVKEYTVGLDALAIYVHKDNPLEEISLEQLAEIYGDGGELVRWSQLRGPADP
jgi:ABC-type phosphate transport system substrate-binding protein